MKLLHALRGPATKYGAALLFTLLFSLPVFSQLDPRQRYGTYLGGSQTTCTRTGVLNRSSFWGPVKLTVKVNAASGTTLRNTASVAAKTQDVNNSNNVATISTKVQ